MRSSEGKKMGRRKGGGEKKKEGNRNRKYYCKIYQCFCWLLSSFTNCVPIILWFFNQWLVQKRKQKIEQKRMGNCEWMNEQMFYQKKNFFFFAKLIFLHETIWKKKETLFFCLQYFSIIYIREERVENFLLINNVFLFSLFVLFFFFQFYLSIWSLILLPFVDLLFRWFLFFYFFLLVGWTISYT